MNRQMRTTGILVLFVALLGAGQATAQNLPTLPDSVFNAAVAAARADLAPMLAAAGTDAAKRAEVYRELLPRVLFHIGDVEFERVNEAAARVGYDALLGSAGGSRPMALRRFVAVEPDSSAAQSLNAPLTNPGGNQVLERSGGTDLVALSADLKQLFSADKSAVTLHLSAFALLGGTNAGGNRGAQYVYGRHEGWRRLTGSVTFGAKLPEKEITGITGLPDAEKAFDAIAWDTKVRLIGDRDPRASHWYPLLLGRLGTITEIVGRLPSSPAFDVQDVPLIPVVLDEALKRELDRANGQIANSLQVSVKFSGQHLTQEANRNKYVGAVMLDKGFNGVDLTANLTYSAADAPAMDATDPFKTKDWQYSVGLTGSILKNAVVTNRAVELSLALSGIVPLDDTAVPVDRKNIFKVNSTLSLPFQQKGKIPISITFSNDPNNVKKEKYVTGQIGVSYDLGAIWDAFK
jgi:hypothetical protein